MPEDEEFEFDEEEYWEEEAFLQGMEEADREVEEGKKKRESLWPEDIEEIEEMEEFE